MGRKKRDTLASFAVQPALDPISQEDFRALEEALECEIGDAFRSDLEGQLRGWLSYFGNYKSYGYGARERRLVASAEQAAAKLHRCLSDLGELADAGLDHFTYAQRITNEQLLAVLASLDGLGAQLDGLVGAEIDVAAIQMHLLQDVVEDHGVPVTVSTKNYVTTFRPSPFTRFVDQLWTLDPRLRVFEPKAADYWDSLSQWIGQQLRKPDALSAIDKLKLLSRPKLK